MAIGAVKLPHHGSKYNLSLDLLGQLACDRYLFSTDGTSAARHPDPVAVARLITSGIGRQLEFNYRSDPSTRWDSPDLRRRYGYEVVYPLEGEQGLTAVL